MRERRGRGNVLDPDARSARGYGVTYSTPRDQNVIERGSRASQMFAALQSPMELPQHLLDSRIIWFRDSLRGRCRGDPATLPQMTVREDKSVLYQFKPQMATARTV